MNITEHKIPLSAGDITVFTAGSGRPLLYLHPAGGVRWSEVLEGLARDHELHVPVAPGFDGTPLLPGVSSMRALGRLAGEYARTHLALPVDVFGHSFGGWVGLWLAAECPDAVDHLVLAGAAGLRRGPGGTPMEPAARRRALFRHPEKIPPQSKPAEVEAANAKLPRHYHGGSEFDETLHDRLDSIDRMALILQGTEDLVVPADCARLLKEKLPRSYLVYIWDAAHAIEVDQPERVLAVTRSFLSRSEAFVVNWGAAKRAAA